ncbi:T9SS type A sorting domain-containing protein [Arachidicoccus terrestris]|uniref:T9SS type A sorting domain-containing protein n=1 Tax=Arachidicoccus terrestris TaxID=2875539 RepID=UPI001CC61955|nr:T9SS type A sorting domain-containing protein [Arachidicoccus terrestris]UAY55544.1 T9SS type A sorting domain-containing protein [Arachidicoccus terrestris]
MLKKFFITFCLYGCHYISFSQTIAPHVIGSGGGSSTLNGYTIDYNIGEMAIQTAGSGPVITQGFEQPELGETPLPVKGLRLQLTDVNNYAYIHFSTIQEFKTDHFIVERSVDGLRFDTLATLQTKAPGGYSATPLYYTYTDPQRIRGKVYYRIVQVDQNGDYNYSSVESLNGTDSHTGETIKIFPNPATTQIQIQLVYAAPKTKLEVYSVTGVLMLDKAISQQTRETISLDKWPAGIYIVVVRNTQGVVQRTKFIKK